jgi:hypothetical protein
VPYFDTISLESAKQYSTYCLKHTTLEVVVVELIIIDVYGSTVFGVVKDYIYNNTGG